MDASDRERVDVAREELARLLAHAELEDASLLVLANKQDLPSAMSSAEVVEKMELGKLGQRGQRGHDWYVQSCCATAGEGLYEGLDWLSTAFQKKR